MLSWQEQIVWIAAGSGLVMFALWLIQLRTKDAGIVDVGWAACIAAAAAFCAFTGEGDLTRRAIIGAMGAIWGVRLALHLLFDRVLRGPEDGRYQMMRELFGRHISPVFLVFFLAQGVLVVMLSAPFLLAARDSRLGPSFLDLLGPTVWLAGMIGETIADRQLSRFKADGANRGLVCNVGLWRYSRHPNYFFEWHIWIGYAIVAAGTPDGWLAWTAPALMLLFMLKLTGIPPTEARALRSRGDAYREYQRTTSAFVPWFPKRPQPTRPKTAA